jgi:nitrogen regulatory protein P-II 1
VKLLTAVVQVHKLDDIRRAPQVFGARGMTVTEVRGLGSQRGHVEVFRGAGYVVEFVPRLRLELLVPDADAADLLRVLVKSAHTGQVGDGRVWSVPVERVVRIRTGERGPEAL